MNTVTLYRPVGEAELELIARSGYRHFPPRLSGQPFFYPVCTREYAEQIARDWNARNGGCGYVTRFEVASEFLARYRVHVVATTVHSEYWIPAEELPAFNDAIVGTIETVDHFGSPSGKPDRDAAPKGRGSGMFAVTPDKPHEKAGEAR